MAERHEAAGHQIDAESALMHVMEDVHRHMNGFDLHNVSRVCRSWRYSALRELARRPRIQQMKLLFETENLATRLDVIPVASILIYDNKLEKKLAMERDRDDVVPNDYEEDVVDDFMKQLPGKTIVLLADKLITTEDVNVQDPPLKSELPPRNYDILGLFFSNMCDRIKIDVTSVPVEDFYEETDAFSLISLGHILVERLGFNCRRQNQSAIIMITSWHAYYYASVLVQKIINCVQEDGERLTYSSLVGAKHVASDPKPWPEPCNEQVVTVLRISGPSVETWSAYIDIRSTRDKLQAQLQELRAKVTHKRHYTGLLYSINCVQLGCNHVEHPCCNSSELMRALKRLFPLVPFVGSFLDIYPPAGEVMQVDIKNSYQIDYDMDNSDHLWNMQFNASIIIIGVD